MKIITPVTLQDFDGYYRLRWEVLRKPWGQPEGSERLQDEESCIHAMVCSEHNEVTGVARLHFNTPTIAQVRFVAVDRKYQGKGIGKMLMVYLENIAREKGAKELVLDARENAVAFYKSLDYKIIEKTYLLFGEIQHYRMKKFL